MNHSIVTTSPFVTGFAPAVVVPQGRFVTLIDGNRVTIDNLSLNELIALQHNQEPAFARAIEQTEKDSTQRATTIQLAYATICSILDEVAKRRAVSGVFSMGMDARYAELVLRSLECQARKGITGGLFELGCSAGGLLGQACRAGYRVGGLEVVPDLLARAKAQIAANSHGNLFLGDFRKVDLSAQFETYSLAYWNDVFEHVPTDEIGDYLNRLYSLLKPGGVLITITPNWHMRPSDVTSALLPSRSEAQGFHLKEYTLREVSALLKQAGFVDVQTPSYISRKRIFTNRSISFTTLKRWLEPALECLPFNVAVQCCRRLGLSCTIATKAC